MALRDDEHWLSLVDAFGAAALGDGDWRTALAGLAQATGSSRAQLIGLGGASSVPFNWLSDFSDEALVEFVALDGGNPSINPRIAAGHRTAVLEMVSEADTVPEASNPRSQPYLDWVERWEIPFGCQTNLIREPDMLIGLAVLRSRREGPTSSQDRAAFAALAPHVRAAVKLQMRLEGQAADLITGTLGAVSLAAFVCDAKGRVTGATAAAETLLGSNGPLLLRRGALSCADYASGERLETAIGRAVMGPAPRGAPASSTVILRGDAVDAPLALDVLSLPRRSWSLGRGPSVLVVARIASDRDDGVTVLRAAYGLTAAEASAALDLARGRTRAMIAQARGVSIDTVRSQLKQVFHKLGVNREIEMAAKLAPLILNSTS
ncbi:hypothetical protein BH10PSE4_BH10PSE4_16770 [soil metagenome]